MDATKIIKNSTYGTENHSMDLALAKEVKRRGDFIKRGDVISHNILNCYSRRDSGAERVIKLKDITFSKPFTGLIKGRPFIHAVVSVHYVARYRIVIKRYEDTSEDIVWYETPINSYYCKISELEDIIHEHILEAIQRDSKWKQLK